MWGLIFPWLKNFIKINSEYNSQKCHLSEENAKYFALMAKEETTKIYEENEV
jgi:hypothetical protein